jgi:uncharacterized phage infection (PIP) family protein YhgE
MKEKGNKKSNKMLVTLVIILIIISIVLISAVGWLLYKNYSNQGNKISNNTIATNNSSSNTANNTTSTTSYGKFVEVVQKNNSVIQETPDKIATTKDQIGVLAALHNTCTGSDNYVAINYDVFTNTSSQFTNTYKQAGDYARIGAAPCVGYATNSNSNFTAGHSGVMYLYKNSDGNWIYGTGGNGIPSCSDVNAYPTTLVSECNDSNNNLIDRTTGKAAE